MKKKTIILVSCLTALLTAAAGVAGWLSVRDGSSDEKNRAGIEWYNPDVPEYTITTAQELYDMAQLSRYYDFAGQTFLLGNDIVFNEGTPEEWGKEPPESLWKSPVFGFAGTFDGQGHTIRGIYALGGYNLVPLDAYYEDHPPVEYWSAKMLYLPTGIFAYTKDSCVIKNLKVTDSIFYNWANTGGGSIVGNGAGTLDTVYSNATMVGYFQNTGGLVGLVENGVFHLNNCWFDGELRMEGPRGFSGGGLIGSIKKSSETTTITHCLNTAGISNEYLQDEPRVGGFAGLLQDGAHLKIEDSLAVGSITVDRNDSVGTAVGRMDGSATLSSDRSYTNLDAYPALTGFWGGTVQSCPIGLKKDCLVGESALAWTDLDYENYWTITDGGTPLLRTFATRTSDKTSAKKAYDISWYDEGQTEYTISTLDQLYGFYILSAEHDFAGRTVKLGNDIIVNTGEAKAWTEKAPEKPWYPINRFAGTFDGQGHAISGVYLFSNQPGTGLFTHITAAGTLKNFRLLNSCFVNRAKQFSFMGSVVGCCEGTVDTVYSNALMSGSAVRSVGGIVGNITGTEVALVTNCWFDGVIELGEHASQGGGIVARNENGSSVRIRHCLNTGSISGGILKGGIIGLVMNGVVEVADCLNVGTIDGEKHVGAATSWIEKQPTLSFENVYAAAESCINTVDNVQSEYTGGCMMIGRQYLTGGSAYSWTMLDFDEYWAIQPGSTPILQSFAESIPSVDGLEKKMDVSWYSVREKEYVLDSPEDLYGFTYLSYNTNFLRKTVRLGEDITLNADGGSDPWFPVCRFNGNFDGQGRTVSGLHYSGAQSGTGMFGETGDKALISDFRLVDSLFIHEGSGNAFMGSVVGRLAGEIRSVYSNAEIRGDRLVYGGIAGAVYDREALISDCWYDGTVSLGPKGGWCGGILGLARSNKTITIEHCLNTGSLHTEYNDAPSMGGLCGLVQGDKTTLTITDSLSAGKVSAKDDPAYVAGLVGFIPSKSNVTMDDVYLVIDANPYRYGGTGKPAGLYCKVERSMITGINGYRMTTLDFDNYWTARSGKLPALTTFTGSGLDTGSAKRLVDTGWYSQDSSVYELRDRDDLIGFTLLSQVESFKDKTVKLAADITVNSGDASNWCDSVPDILWVSALKFAGTFDGQGHTISGICQNTTVQNGGLFASTTTDAVIKDLRLVNSCFRYTGQKPAQMGSVAGDFAGRMERVYSDALISGDRLVYGGLAGLAGSEAVISECWFDGSISLGSKGGWCGGILGLARSDKAITIKHCLNTGSISTQYNNAPSMGGLCGLVQGDKTTLTIKDSLSAGRVTAKDDPAYVAGLVGFIPSKSNVTMDDVYLVIDANPYRYGGTGKPAGLYCKVERSMITGINGYRMTTLDFDNYWTARSGKLPALTTFTGSGLDTGSAKRLVDTGWYSQDSSVYELRDRDDLIGFTLLSQVESFKDKTVKLAADITVNSGDASNWCDSVPDILWVSALKFAGTFDGQGHSISGIYQNTSEQNGGLFASTLADSVIKDLYLVNSYFEYTGQKPAQMGAVAGDYSGRMERVYTDALISGDRLVYGGLVGRVSGSAVMDSCWFDGSISLGTKGGWCGGFAGSITKDATLAVRHCLMTGNIVSEYEAAPSIGGICGNVSAAGAELTVYDTLVAAAVTCPAASYVGALTGNVSEGASLTMDRTYVTYETHSSVTGSGKGTREGTAVRVLSADLPGIKGYQFTDLNFETYWAAESDNVPVPKAFAKSPLPIETGKAADTSWYTDEAYQEKGYYELSSAADLYGFRLITETDDFAGKIVKLGADIDLNPGWDGTSVPDYLWTPAAGTDRPFAGTFDGQGHSIRGMYVEASMRYTGLFAATSPAAILRDLRLENGRIVTDHTFAGSVAGGFAGTAERIYSNVSIEGSGPSRYGGLFGANTGAVSVSECWYDGTVSAPGKSYIGGLIGLLQNTDQPVTIEHSLFSGSLEGENQAAGLIGMILSSVTGGVTVNDCASLGTVSGTARSGMLIGENAAALTVTHSTGANEGELKALIGTDSGTSAVTDSIRYTASVPSTFVGIGGLAALDGRGILPAQWKIREGGVPVPGYFGPSQSDTYTIGTAGDLLAFASASQSNAFAGWTIRLGADIDLNPGWDASSGEKPDQVWTPIGSQSRPFAGMFDGQGHTISGVYLNTSTARQGLFGETSAASVLKDFRLTNSCLVTSTFRLGSIAGNLGGKAEGIYSNAFVTATGGSNRIGGLFGVVNNASVSGCWYDGVIKAQGISYVGGIIGSVQDADQPVILEHSLFSGSVSGSNQVGGLIGMVLGSASGGVTIHDCASLGTVSGTAKSGMLAGESAVVITVTHSAAANEGTIKDMVGTGSINVSDSAKLITTVPSQLTGDTGREKLEAYLDFTDHWAVRGDAVPAPKRLTASGPDA